MDELTYSARRATAAQARPPEGSADFEARFRSLVQSPLRAGLLRHLNARPLESFDVESLMATFGRLQLDVDHCLTDLVECGVARRVPGARMRYSAARPASHALALLLDGFLERRVAISTEDQAPSVQRFREMIGRDEKMLVVFEWIRTAAKSDISVLILGPTGSGKDVVARMIHELSSRGREDFQEVDCAALPDTLFESEMFGFDTGALAGAHDRTPGQVERANHGTLFLDDIGDLSLVAQARLLRALEGRRVERSLGQNSAQADFRLISATNRPLEQLVRDRGFREDLYYRVNAFSIHLPSLRERPVDIPVLAGRFAARYCANNGLPLDGKTFSPEAITRLQAYHWPANVRELESTVSRAALSAPGAVIRDTDIEFLHASLPPIASDTAPRMPTLRDTERSYIVRVLDAVSWNKKEAARVLDISRGTLYRKIFDYGLKRTPGAGSPR